MAVRDGKTRITFSIPIEILEKIDVNVKKSYITRSKWIIDAIIDRIDKEEKLEIDRIVKGIK